MTTTILSIELNRTDINADATPAYILYTMKKKTPAGPVEATAAIPYQDIVEIGIEAMDGRMFFSLGEQVNREEMNRYLEIGANSAFGEEAAA